MNTTTTETTRFEHDVLQFTGTIVAVTNAAVLRGDANGDVEVNLLVAADRLFSGATVSPYQDDTLRAIRANGTVETVKRAATIAASKLVRRA